MKCRLVKALVFPLASYGSKTWTISKAHREKINAFEMWCWRRLFRIPWTAKRTNISVREKIGEMAKLHQQIMKQTM